MYLKHGDLQARGLIVSFHNLSVANTNEEIPVVNYSLGPGWNICSFVGAHSLFFIPRTADTYTMVKSEVYILRQDYLQISLYQICNMMVSVRLIFLEKLS